MSQHYDYIIAGAGLSGLSLSNRLSDPIFSDKRILLLDKSPKDVNDRTWSFWAKTGDHPYAAIYKKTWDKFAFLAPGVSKIETAGPYRYHTISALDFYNHSLEIIDKTPHLTFVNDEILSINDLGDMVSVETRSEKYTTDFVFDSIVKKFPLEDSLFVWQHFMGWEVRLDESKFDDNVATLMDFRIDQGDGDTRFVYVLPFDERTALVEFTLFSKNIWAKEEYEQVLTEYMDKYVGHPYSIISTEIGKIPMTMAPFSKGSRRVIPIGTNNATVKPSSGYAFTRIQKECDMLIERITAGKIRRVRPSRKFRAYDRTLLNVLLTKKKTGRDVFAMMFKRNSTEVILKFLDDATSLLEEIQIFRTLPFWPFLKGFTYENVFRSTKSGLVSNP